MEERDRIKKLASKDPNLWPRYKILRNKVTNNIRLSVSKYYQELVTKNKNDPKKMWKTIDKIPHKTSGTTTISELKEGDTIVKEQNQIAEKLNEHFVSIAYKSNLSIGHRETHKSFNFTLISQWCCRILVT